MGKSGRQCCKHFHSFPRQNVLKRVFVVHTSGCLSCALNWGWTILLTLWTLVLSISQLRVVPGGSQAQFSAHLWLDTKYEHLKFLYQSFSNLRELLGLGCLQEDFIHRSLQQLPLLLTWVINPWSFNSHARTSLWPKSQIMSRYSGTWLKTGTNALQKQEWNQSAQAKQQALITVFQAEF